MQLNPSYTNITEERVRRCGITGTGAANPTVRAGPGITVTRQAAGVYRFSFTENPGVFVMIDGWALRADTMSGVKGYSISGGVYTKPAGTTKGYIDISIWDASNNAVDLAALQYLDIVFAFSNQSRIT